MNAYPSQVEDRNPCRSRSFESRSLPSWDESEEIDLDSDDIADGNEDVFFFPDEIIFLWPMTKFTLFSITTTTTHVQITITWRTLYLLL